MVCCLFGDNALSEPMLVIIRPYFHDILFEIEHFPFKKMHMKMSSAKLGTALSSKDIYITAYHFKAVLIKGHAPYRKCQQTIIVYVTIHGTMFIHF